MLPRDLSRVRRFANRVGTSVGTSELIAPSFGSVIVESFSQFSRRAQLISTIIIDDVGFRLTLLNGNQFSFVLCERTVFYVKELEGNPI